MSKKIVSIVLLISILTTLFSLNLGSINTMALQGDVITYSKAADGEKYLSKNFKVKEFACNDGSDPILIDPELVVILQTIRDHFGVAVTITSAYRSPSYNASIGGASQSYHTKGMAADIVVSGVAPEEVAKYAETIGVRGIGRYSTSSDGYFCHVDSRPTKSYWIGQSSTYTATHGGSYNTQPYAWPPLDQGITNTTTTLKVGDNNTSVKQLQASLNKLMNAGLTVDGIFGTGTETAVKKFQAKYGLTVDGLAGPATIAKINEFIKNGVPEDTTPEITAPENQVAETGYDRGYKGGTNGEGVIFAHGLDVSAYQKNNINFAEVKAAGYDYVILRCGVSSGKDVCFDDFYTSAKNAGLDVGAYFYSYALSADEAYRDAISTINFISGKKFEYPIYFDYENDTQAELDNSLDQSICLTYLDTLASYGYLTGIYTGKYFSTQIPLSTICAKYEFWVAHYYDYDYKSYHTTYSSTTGMYQYTDRNYINNKGPYDGDVTYKDYPAIVKAYGFNGYEATDTSYISTPLDQGITKTGLTLKNGTSSFFVMQLQASLNSIMNAGLTIDGSFGPATETAVKTFQASCGLEETGIVESTTTAKINEFIKNGQKLDTSACKHSTLTDWSFDKKPSTGNSGIISRKCAECGEVVETMDVRFSKAASEISYDFYKNSKIDDFDITVIKHLNNRTDFTAITDINGDGTSNLKDLVRAKKIAAGFEFEEEVDLNYDRNFDGVANAADLVFIQDYVIYFKFLYVPAKPGIDLPIIPW